MPEGLTIASYNVHGCVGLDFRHHPDRVRRVIESFEAEVVALQEVWTSDNSTAETLDEMLGPLRDRFCVTLGPTLQRHERYYGNALLTRTPPESVDLIALPPVVGREPRGLISARVRVQGGGCLQLFVTHLGLSFAERRIQIRQIADLCRTANDPVLVLGDFNEVSSRSSRLRPMWDAGLLPTTVPTFPSPCPFLALDRAWAGAVHLDSIRVVYTLQAVLASDHLPLLMTLHLDTPNRTRGRSDGS